MGDSEDIDPRKIRPGPIRYDSLPPELLEQIKVVFDLLGPYLGTSLEQFEINFMRDSDPDKEVAVWISIMAAWMDYHEKYVGEDALPDNEERKLLAALIAISTGLEDVSKLNVPVEAGQRLLRCYDDLAGG